MPFFLHDGSIHFFAHVPKCGGTAVEKALIARFGGLAFLDGKHFRRIPGQRWSRTSPQHVTAEVLTRYVPQQMIGTSFALVRHPLRRVISAYQHAQRRHRLPSAVSPEAWLRHYAATRDVRPWLFDNHLRPAVEFLLPDTTVFRLEDGMESMSHWLRQQYGSDLLIAEKPLNEHHAPDNAREQPVSQKLRELVVDLFADDFERFDYDPDAFPELSVTRLPPLAPAAAWAGVATVSYMGGLARARFAKFSSDRKMLAAIRYVRLDRARFDN